MIIWRNLAPAVLGRLMVQAARAAADRRKTPRGQVAGAAPPARPGTTTDSWTIAVPHPVNRK